MSELSDEEWYIMNEDEKELKSLLWHEMNPEYDDNEEKRKKDLEIWEKKAKWPKMLKESLINLD